MTFLPWQVVRFNQGSYSQAYSLIPGLAVDALHRKDSRDWLFSVETTAILDGIVASPSDVMEHHVSSGGYAKRFDGAGNGVPPGVNVDAVFLDGGDGGDLVLSFDVPVALGGATYEPSDLVRFNGSSFSLFFDASAAIPPMPPSANVTGADRRGDITVLSFDAPVTLGSQTFLPGDLVSWNGSGFGLFQRDPAWPHGSCLDAVALLARPGRIPPTLEVSNPTPPGGRLRLRLSWSASCSAGAEDYGLYEGTIGQWYSHTALDCSDPEGDLTEDITPSAGDRYYLVVPFNGSDEGSYGLKPDLTERPRGLTTCVATQLLGGCP